MRNFATASLFTLLACSAALVAQDEASLLGRLQAETRALAKAAEGTLVTVRAGAAGTGAGGATYVADERGNLYALDPESGRKLAVWVAGVAHVAGSIRTEAVLAGAPPRVVVPHAAVGKATRIEVRLADGREVEAKLLDSDADLGVAVFGLPDGLEGVRGLEPAAAWDDLRAGSLAVVAGGAGEGLMGLALLRSADPRLGSLDAAEGPSGAALVGVKGTLLGLRSTARVVDSTTCKACHTGAVQPFFDLTRQQAAHFLAQGAYARATAATRDPSPHFIPGPVIHRVLEDIAAHGRIRHAYLGVVLGDTAGDGVLLGAVLADSPAQAAGLKTGQRIVRVDGVPCGTSARVSRALALKRPGEKVVFGVAAGKDEVTDVEVTLADRADAQRDLVSAEAVGIECVDLGPDLRSFLGLGDGAGGVVVQQVREGSPAARVGLRRGDVIQWGGGGPVTNAEELLAALAAADGGTLELRALRDGRVVTVDLPLAQSRETPR